MSEQRSGKVRILKQRCETCIFRPGNLMHLGRGRVAGMVRECEKRDTFIPCHEFLGRYGGASVVGPRANGAICGGFYKAGYRPSIIQLAERLDFIEWVEVKKDGS